jgi:carbon monoxide dehydrogenase subunit G
MEMVGEYRIPLRRDRVWERLNDPETLRQSITGCDELIRTSETTFAAKVTTKVGPIEAQFSGTFTLGDLDPPNGYTIAAEGSGEAAGFASGAAVVRLAAAGEDTLISYTVDASVGGELKQIDAGLIDAAASTMADSFFRNFAALVSAPTRNEVVMVPVEHHMSAATSAFLDDLAAAPATATEAEPMTIESVIAESPFSASPESIDPPASEHPPRHGGLPPRIWVAGIVIICGFLLWYFAP